jgi:hypothetical protein
VSRNPTRTIIQRRSPGCKSLLCGLGLAGLAKSAASWRPPRLYSVCPCLRRKLRELAEQNAERLFEGVPKILVRNGQVRRLALIQERITRSGLIEALRREGCTSLSRVRFSLYMRRVCSKTRLPLDHLLCDSRRALSKHNAYGTLLETEATFSFLVQRPRISAHRAVSSSESFSRFAAASAKVNS